jgi:Riboflavin kinase
MSNSTMSSKIRRKPVPVSVDPSLVQSPTSLSPGPNSAFSSRATEASLVQSPISITTKGDSSYDSSLVDQWTNDTSRELGQIDITPLTRKDHETRPAPVPNQPLREADGNAKSPSVKSNKSAPLVAGQMLRSAYGEVRHFAGGLISHPHESTKHYTILRHSHGLVYYSGSYTNLAITVFADRELPPDRSFWLQRKGWSGKTGMRAGVLFGTHGAWVDVTPSVAATPDQLKPADDRAWQRDIKKFLRKASKKLADHQVRETNVLRIPCGADDGYLRVVMCAGEKGKKSLCPSPVFRLASTSMSSSSIRGASLSTLPLEAAIKVGTIAARQTANAFAGPYAETARSFATSQISSVYQPSALAQSAMTTAYDTSGVPDRIDKMNQEYDIARESSCHGAEENAYDALSQPMVIGSEAGPVKPYPVRFHGRIEAGSGHSMATLGIPTANVTNVDSDILLRHSGIHFGWAAVNVPKKMREELLVDDDWHEAIISIIPNPDSRANVVQKKVIRVYIIEDFEGAKFFDTKVSVIMMGYIRPGPQSTPREEQDLEAKIADIYRDVASATSSLARPAWKAEETLERISSAASSRSFTEKYVDMRQSTQKQIDRVPTWRLGVRTDGAVLKDQFVGTGGITIPR